MENTLWINGLMFPRDQFDKIVILIPVNRILSIEVDTNENGWHRVLLDGVDELYHVYVPDSSYKVLLNYSRIVG